jgi:cytochrome c-type biogenesis protein CcmE
MSPIGRRRLFLVVALGVAPSALGVVAYGNIGENLVYYWDPTQLVAHGDDAVGAVVRLGGVVKPGTVNWQEAKNSLTFEVTDGVETVKVEATGAPPQMFREGIGVVVEGSLTESGEFHSDRLMVKHSNEYRAPADGVAKTDLYKTVEDM